MMSSYDYVKKWRENNIEKVREYQRNRQKYSENYKPKGVD